jgi:uncharacterized membrane protein SpoIIM required for sporulation
MKKKIEFIFNTIINKRTFYLIGLMILSMVFGYFWGDLVLIPIPSISKINDYETDTGIISLTRKLFFNNYLYALILVFVGYFTGGVVTIILLTLNGLSFGFSLNYLDVNRIGGIFGAIKRLIFHAPLEIFALCLMASIGLRGFDLVETFVKTKHFSIDQILVTKQMVYQYFAGTLLLFIAALIESLISYII